MEFPHRLKRFAHWHRRAIAAALAGLSVMVLAAQLVPVEQPGMQVVVTTRELAAGSVVSPADVASRHLPAGAVPEGTLLGVEDVVGSTVGARMQANSVVQAGMLATTDQLEAGRALVPIAVPDAQLAQLLRPGNPVSLVFSGDGFDVITDDARVAALPSLPEERSLSAGGGRAPVVLVDVPSDVAPMVSALGQRGELSVILGRG